MTKRHGYTTGEEIANAVTHVVGSHLGAAMLALLVWQGATSGADVAWKVTSGAIFGFSMIFLYAISSAYHTVTYLPAKRVLHVMDHMAIYFLIAGSYTPFCLVTLRPDHPVLAWTVFGIEWGMAVAG
ncbi:MAG: hemolysin III family protein, partial [Kiritimatiellae bacterium]|nr:hemolysin III family protein [Kiritimatiellia bacterium]